MRRLISEEEIFDCRNTNSIFNLNKYIPVEVAEEKIKNIAIEYGLWLDNNYWSKHAIGGWYNTTSYSLMENPLSSEQLFEKFLYTRE